jgi:Mg/Co/Ni transporter MgtE
LISEGYSVEDSKKLIGCVVVAEIFDVVKKQETFNPERFAKALQELPKLPQD